MNLTVKELIFRPLFFSKIKNAGIKNKLEIRSMNVLVSQPKSESNSNENKIKNPTEASRKLII